MMTELDIKAIMGNDQEVDMVNNPPHYNQGEIECIDAIESALGYEGFIAYCRGNIIKYNWRLGLKGDAAEQSAKASFYQARITKTIAKQETK